jgi:hypothetical protein
VKQFTKSICLLVAACTFWSAATAQKNEILNLQPKRVTIPASCFSNVEVLDSRLDTSNLGFIQRGLLNRMAYVTTSRPLKDELASTVTTLIKDASKQDGTLLINLRQFKLTEFDGKGAENGVFRISAVFYLKQGPVYRKILNVNTSVVVRGLDVTERLLDTVHEALGAFIQQAAGFDVAKIDPTTQFTAQHYESIDELEKEKVPVYNVDLLQKGLYATFEEFKNNRPSAQVIVQMDASGKPQVYEMKENGKKGRKIRFDNYYAVCDGEKMFISGDYALYPLSKRDTDFYFRAPGKEGGDGSLLVAPNQTIIVSRTGELPAYLKYDWSIVVFKIDHITGRFIPVRMVED